VRDRGEGKESPERKTVEGDSPRGGEMSAKLTEGTGACQAKREGNAGFCCGFLFPSLFPPEVFLFGLCEMWHISKLSEKED